ADEVDGFLEMAAERLEELVKENLKLQERVDRLQEQVSQQENREEAVREALVTAQELRRDMRVQARREAELLRKEAESEISKIIGEAERQLAERQEALEEMERMRLRFLKSFRSLLEREMDAVEVEEGRKPLEETPLEIDFTVKDIEAQVDFSEGLDEEVADPGTPDAGQENAGQPDQADERSGGGVPEDRRAQAPGEAGSTPRAPERRGSPQPEEGEGPLLLSSFLEEQDEERRSGDSGS
ncbi:MAG: DivIVA domain-containing protein, partial [Longimicrobiales bacterium]|nr:DivIVA domain-containing protein [Longimicrobiales bacterium]